MKVLYSLRQEDRLVGISDFVGAGLLAAVLDEGNHPRTELQLSSYRGFQSFRFDVGLQILEKDIAPDRVSALVAKRNLQFHGAGGCSCLKLQIYKYSAVKNGVKILLTVSLSQRLGSDEVIKMILMKTKDDITIDLTIVLNSTSCREFSSNVLWLKLCASTLTFFFGLLVA